MPAQPFYAARANFVKILRARRQHEFQYTNSNINNYACVYIYIYKVLPVCSSAYNVQQKCTDDKKQIL